MQSGDPALEEEQKLRNRVTKGAWGIAKDKAIIHMSMEKVAAYEAAFAKIQKATNITEIDELVQVPTLLCVPCTALLCSCWFTMPWPCVGVV